MRARFLSEGLDGFDDHQVLEVALFYAVARVDTNPIAHRLMNRYGSLAAVLELAVDHGRLEWKNGVELLDVSHEDRK